MNNETERLANLLVDQNFILRTFQKENISIFGVTFIASSTLGTAKYSPILTPEHVLRVTSKLYVLVEGGGTFPQNGRTVGRFLDVFAQYSNLFLGNI